MVYGKISGVVESFISERFDRYDRDHNGGQPSTDEFRDLRSGRDVEKLRSDLESLAYDHSNPSNSRWYTPADRYSDERCFDEKASKLMKDALKSKS